MTRKILPDMLCESGDCQRPATHMAYSRKAKTVLVCCESHSDSVADEGQPEYVTTCKNCGCLLPIN